MSIQLEIAPILITLTRLRVLRDVVGELVTGFGAQSALDVIQTGIENQVLKKIWINYVNGKGKLVGRVVITIDWDKHRILAQPDNSPGFEIDTAAQSIMGQISQVYPLLIAHTERMRSAYEVTEITVHVTYTAEVQANAQKLQAARKLLDTSPVAEYEWAERPKQGKQEIELEYISRRLAELKVRIEHNKP